MVCLGRCGGESEIAELRERLRWVMHEVSKAETHAGLPPLRVMPIKIPAGVLAQVRTDKRSRAEAKERGPSAVRELMLSNASAMKNPWLTGQVVDALVAGEKIVVFHGRVDACEALGAAITRKAPEGAIVRTICGEESSRPGVRREVMREFITSKSPMALVCMLQAWGESIDGLQYATQALFALLPSTVQQAMQGLGRFDRKEAEGGGVPPSTTVKWPIALGTIDEMIHDTVLTRLDVTGVILDDQEATDTALALRGGRTDEDIVNELMERALASGKWGADDDE